MHIRRAFLFKSNLDYTTQEYGLLDKELTSYV